MTDSPEGDLIMDRAFRDKIGPMAFRLALGLVCLIHGFSKIRIGGGTGWNPALATHWQMAISWGELVCGILVIIGMQCRPAAAGLFLILLSESVLQYQWDLWKLPLREWETTLVFLLMALGVASIGGGEWIIDLRLGGSGTKSSRKQSPALQPVLK